MRPHHLPAAVSSLISVSVPVTGAWNVPPLDDDFQLRLIADDGRVAVHADGNGVGFPKEVVDLSGGDGSEVLLSRKGATGRIDKLEVISVKLTSLVDLCLNERPKAGTLGGPNEINLRAGQRGQKWPAPFGSARKGYRTPHPAPRVRRT